MPRKRSGSNRFLPKYVSAFESQHGTIRHRFRRKGYRGGYFEAALGTEEFREEYHAFMHPGEVEKPKPKPRAVPGTIDELVDRYVAVPERLGPTVVTQAKVRAVVEDFRAGRGDRRIRKVTFEALDKIIAKKKVKTGTGNKTKGGIHAARKLRKELVRLFDFGVKSGLCDANPVLNCEKVKTPKGEKKGGFHPWSEAEIDQYRQHWPLGTRERLAMELLLWTDQRRSDVVKLGKAQIRNGRLPVVQEKGGKELWLAVAPQLLEAIVAMKPEDTSPFCFLVTRFGKPFTKESFGNFFKSACAAANLAHCTAHGLRKATLRRLAELKASNKMMKSVSGQTRDETLNEYIASADQKRLADSAITALARWEMGARKDAGDEEYRFTAND